ncbi:hypothetical protein KJ761_00465 [Patescibacteria group bacterium]|nr:hypothetical protein [Patescibacteria group bacterium]
MTNVHLDDSPSSKNKTPENVLKELKAGMFTERSTVETWDDLEKVAKFKIKSALEETNKIKKEAEDEIKQVKSLIKLPPEQVREIEIEKGIDDKIIKTGKGFGTVCEYLIFRIQKIIEEEKQKVGKEKYTERNMDELEKSMWEIGKVYKDFKQDVSQLEEELRRTLDDFRVELENAQKDQIVRGLSRNRFSK